MQQRPAQRVWLADVVRIPIRDGHFTTGQGFVTFLNPGSDGRMRHLASRRRLHKRSA